MVLHNCNRGRVCGFGVPRLHCSGKEACLYIAIVLSSVHLYIAFEKDISHMDVLWFVWSINVNVVWHKFYIATTTIKGPYSADVTHVSYNIIAFGKPTEGRPINI